MTTLLLCRTSSASAGHRIKQYHMLGTPARGHSEDNNNRPSVATLGLFDQNTEDSALMENGVEEFNNHRESTISTNSLTIRVDCGAS